ncbi:MAG: hypothetical protein WCZ89_04000 [Phycisphaerae bacterium]
MIKFSNDSDILKYEPILFGEMHFKDQILIQGSGGSVSGTIFTVEQADFITVGVLPGHVVYLKSSDEKLEGVFEIVSVNSAAELCISVIRADYQDNPVGLPATDNISFRISTLAPQANIAAFALTEYFGIRPGSPASRFEISDIFDRAVLRQASVFSVISTVYATLAGKENSEQLWAKSKYYKDCFKESRSRLRLSIDKNSDGTIERTSLGGSVRLVRD